jgi:uncharacterized metal-binding protein
MAEDGYPRSCVDCVTNSCRARDGAFPSFCLMDGFDLEDARTLSAELGKPEVHEFVEDAAQNASYSYANELSRIEETINFARRSGYTKIGIAACTSLVAEARMAARIFRAQGFEVFGAMCKVGSLSRPDLGIEEGNPDSVLCNPIYQAQLINERHVDLNVIIGLCVGHDSLFMKYADAPCTVLVTKDYRFDNCAVRGLREHDESGLCERLLEGIQ